MSLFKSAVRKGFKSLGYELKPYTPHNREELSQLNKWQEAFCDWNAERLGISSEESRSRSSSPGMPPPMDMPEQNFVISATYLTKFTAFSSTTDQVKFMTHINITDLCISYVC